MKIDGIYKKKRIDGPYARVIEKMTFEQILEATMPEIEYLSRTTEGLVKTHEPEDIIQELSFKLWKIIKDKKLPEDMIYLDYRYSKFIDKCFKRTILDLQKMTYERSMRDERYLKDTLDRSLPMCEGFDEFYEEK